jgi:predicted nicotinamide N-methyase
MPASKKKRQTQTSRQAFGLTVLKAADPRIRSLKPAHAPSLHGNKFWSSSWAIMDFLTQQGLPSGARVMDVGCGWGLAGIFCAHRFAAQVTSVDADPEVFPYLELHARLNGVQLETRTSTFEQIGGQDLQGHHVVLGADICFWDEMTQPLVELTRRGLDAGVQQILIADPGRPPFTALSDRCVAEFGAEVKSWDVETPVRARAELLIVGALPAAAS